eukprot:gene6057-2521_t
MFRIAGRDFAKRGFSFWFGVCCFLSAMSYGFGGLAIRWDSQMMFLLFMGLTNCFSFMVLATLLVTHGFLYADANLISTMVSVSIGAGNALFALADAEMTALWGDKVEYCFFVIAGVSLVPVVFAKWFQYPSEDVQKEAFDGLTISQVLWTWKFWTLFGFCLFSLTPGWGLSSTYTDMFMRVGQWDHKKAAQLTAATNGVFLLGRIGGGLVWSALGRRGSILLLGTESVAILAAGLLADKAPFSVFIALIFLVVFCFGGSQVHLGPLCVHTFGHIGTGTAYSLIMVA